MSRLPSVGGDDGAWGTILNDFLSVSHQTDGTILPAAVVSKADDTTVVHNTGNETIAGTKTFSTAPTLPQGQALAGVTITSVQQITAAAYTALGTPNATTLYVIVG